LKLKKRFQKIHIEITNICNLQCSFCPPVQRTKKMMDLDLFRQLIAEIAPLTELVCLHLMGEPLAHPQFVEMVEICDQYALNIFLVTNGVLMKSDKHNILLHPRFYQINLSLHSFYDNFADADASRYLQRIFDFTDRALEERPDLYINYRLWNLSDPQGQKHLNQEMLQRVCEYYQYQAPQLVDVRRQKSFKMQGRLYLHFDTEFVWPNMELPLLGEEGRCYGLKSHFGVLADGTVVPCCLDKEGVIALGHFPENSLTAILASERAMNILNGFRNKRLIEPLCQRCQYIQRFNQNPLGATSKENLIEISVS